MKKNTLKKELDWVSMLVPLAIVLTVCALFMIFPEGSKLVLSVVRGFLGDDFGLYFELLLLRPLGKDRKTQLAEK